MAKDFKVIINDPEQRNRFVDVFGTNVLCVKSIFPRLAALPKIGERRIYELDLKEISPEQRARLVAYLAGHFHLDPLDVERDLDTIGCPILADGCTLVVENPAKWFY